MLCLMIAGFDIDPAQITDILAITPSFTGRKGDALPSSHLRRKSIWRVDLEWDASMTSGKRHHELLEDLLSLCDGKQPNFAKLRAEVNPQTVSIYDGLHLLKDHVKGVWLTAEQMRVLADCGIE